MQEILFGEVSEWSKVRAWKARVGQPTAGPNPVPSAIENKNPPVNLVVFHITGKTLLHRQHEIVRSLTMPIANLSVIF